MQKKPVYQTAAINWQKHIDNYRVSNQSKAAYCAAKRISLKQFKYHYRRWHEKFKKTYDNTSSIAPPSFSPVILKYSPPAVDKHLSQPTNSGIELKLSNGVCCKVEMNFCKKTLKQLMEIL